MSFRGVNDVPSYPAYPTVVVGDLHGHLSLLRQLLTELGFTDPNGHWTGGARRLIQVGDLIDRGPAPLDTLDFIMNLQAEALAAGGELICLLGNHELMALRAGAGDHEARISWAYNGAGANLSQWAARTGARVDESTLPYPEEFFAEFAPTGRYGQWLRTFPLACRAGEYAVVHAGWTPDDPAGVAEANGLLRDAPVDSAGFLAALAPLHGLVWARKQSDADIAGACARLGCRGLIAGHTVQPGIRTSAGGQLIQIDVGMWYCGVWAAVGLTADGALHALVQGTEPVLVTGDGLVPVPLPRAGDPAPAGAPRFQAGDLVRVYRAADGSHLEYMRVDGFGLMYGYPAYAGKLFTYSRGNWEIRPSLYFCDRVDRFGRPAQPDEVPADIQQK